MAAVGGDVAEDDWDDFGVGALGLRTTAFTSGAPEAGVVHPAYGFGFSLLSHGGYGHAGAGPGANGELHILPETGYVLVVLANRDPRMAADIVDMITSMLPRNEP
jgi:CubicO group peptidase (beta-lactamase class C family)